MVKVDLHIHSSYSDGKYSPRELIDLAIERKIPAISITDHDTVIANPEAQEYAKQKGITYIPGIEITITPPPSCKELHMVGLFIDSNTRDISNLKKRHNLYTEIVTKKMINKLQKLGYKISFSELKKESKNGSLSRPFIADLLLKKYPLDFSDISDVFNKLLGKDGKAFVRPKGTEMKDAIRIIHQAGGIAIIAHPWYLGECMDGVIEEFVSLGGEGIERDYTPKESIPENMGFRLDQIIKKYNLIVSGGTDFHEFNPSKKKDLGMRGLVLTEFEDLYTYYHKNIFI